MKKINERRNIVKKLFGYKCPYCGKGTVHQREILNYWTKVDSNPFVVPKAIIGKCDVCGKKCFHPQERERWKKFYIEHVPKPTELEHTANKLICIAEIIKIDVSNGLWQLKRLIEELKKRAKKEKKEGEKCL